MVVIFPHITVGFLFSCLHPAFRLPPSVVRRPSSAALTVDLTQLISHTTHLTHNSSLTQLIASHTTHLTQLISHNSSRAPHLTDVLLGRRSTQSLLTEVRRGLAPQWPRLLVAWQAQYREPPEGAAARIGAAVAAAACCVAGAVRRACYRSCGADWRRSGRGCLLCGRRSTESLLKELRRGLAPPWSRLVVARQAQYTTPPEGAAARIGAAVAAVACCVAGAVLRASWRSCGADWRRRGRVRLFRGRRSTQSLLQELRRGLAPPWPRLLVAWQAQYTQPPEGAAARIGAAVAAAGLSPLLYWRLQKRCLRDRYVSPQL